MRKVVEDEMRVVRMGWDGDRGFLFCIEVPFPFLSKRCVLDVDVVLTLFIGVWYSSNWSFCLGVGGGRVDCLVRVLVVGGEWGK